MEIWIDKENLFITCRENLLNEISGNVSNFTLLASLTSLAMMAFERALSIVAPFKFRLVDSRHYFCAIGCSWCLSIMIFLRHLNCHSSLINSYMAFVTLISILIIIISYATIVLKRLYFPEINISITMRNNLKLAKTLMLTTLVALVTWVPSFIILNMVGRGYLSHNIGVVFVMVIYSNSFANLLVYTIRMPQFRRELYKIIKCKRINKIGSQQTSSEGRTARTNTQSFGRDLSCKLNAR